MNGSQQGQRILRQVKLLAAVGLALVVVTMGLVRWRVIGIRSQRAQAKMEMEALEKLSNRLLQNSLEGKTWLQAVLESEVGPSTGADSVGRLEESIRELSQERPHPVTHLKAPPLDVLATRLATVTRRTLAWRSSYERAWQGAGQRRTHDMLLLGKERMSLREEQTSLFHDIDELSAEAMQAVRAHGQVLTQQVEGSVTSALRRLIVLHGAAAVLFLWLSWRITGGIRAQIDALEEAHRVLLATSRRAGMAEVATSVLHNLGNVLNSANVSATLVADRLRSSRVASLGKAVALLREHEADLGSFLTTDHRGRQLPAFLARLAENLSAENAELLLELGLLQKHIDHVKEVVARQQSHAQVAGVAETVDATVLVEDALRLSSEPLSRSGAEVLREFGPVPPISVDRHKVLQILVNLMRNAAEACQEAGPQKGRLRLGLRGDRGRISFSVSDNGVGIAQEDLSRIFSHGFTTKQDGYGFSLHASALAAKELGGALHAASEGPGQGATFTLELPLCPPAVV